MGCEAGVDEAVLHGLGIEHRHLACRLFERERLGRRMIRAFLAKGRVIHPAHGGREPYPTLLVEHGVVIIRPSIPKFLFTPVSRSLQWLDAGGMTGPERFRHLGIRHRHLAEPDLVRLLSQGWPVV